MAEVLIALVVLVIVVIALVWLIDYINVPHPINWILKVALGLLAVLWFINRFGGEFGVNF